MNNRWFKNKEEINSFLSFEYIPEKSMELSEDFLKSCSKSNLKLNKTRLIKEGKKSLEKGFGEALSEYPNDVQYIIPLSAGLDSRAILGFLLKTVEKKRIITFTVGTPGTIDYEIGQNVANKAGVKNYAFNLTPNEFHWTENFLLKCAETYERPKNLFGMRDVFQVIQNFFHRILDKDYIILTGFLGGVLAGAHLPEKRSETWQEAINHFLNYNYYHPNLTSDDFNPISVLPREPEVNGRILSYDEQLDFGIRQKYYIEPALILNESFKAPFISKSWLDFILNIPRKYKKKQILYKHILKELYPEIFQVGVSTNTGLTLFVNPLFHKIYKKYKIYGERFKLRIGSNNPKFNTNKFDWDVELRRSKSFLKMINRQVNDLEKRNCLKWIEPSHILKKHLKKTENLGREIKMLTSLEIFLKIQDY